MREKSAFPIGTDGLPVYPTRAEAIEMVERVTRERDEAVALLRSAEWRLRAIKRNELAEKNDAVHADGIRAFLARLDAIAKGGTE